MVITTAIITLILDSLDGAPFGEINIYQGINPLHRSSSSRGTTLPIYHPLASVYESNRVGNSKVVVIWRLASDQILVEEINMNILNQMVDLDLIWIRFARQLKKMQEPPPPPAARRRLQGRPR